jgi:hypothetical protein
MHPAIKILVGALMVVVGIFTTWNFLDQLVVVLKGAVGPLLVLIGAFIVWLESDEWKMEREDESSMNVQQQFQPRGQQAQEQQQQTVDEEPDTHACPECGKEFDTERGMKIHMAQKHE